MEHRKLKILGIAPYDGMKVLMEKVAEQRNDIILDAFVGDLYDGVEIVKNRSHYNYDAIISRGGTAELIEKVVDIPTIEVEFSVYDILRAIKLAENYSDRHAIVGFPAITRSAHLLCDLLQYKIDIYTLHGSEDVEPLLAKLQKEKYHMVICDMITKTLAIHHNLNSILITSGNESINAAFDHAIKLCGSYIKLKDKVQLFSSLLENPGCDFALFEQTGDCMLSHLTKAPEDFILPVCSRLMANYSEESGFYQKKWNDTLISINKRRINFEENHYFAFYINYLPLPINSNKLGITFYSREEAADTFLQHFHGLSSQSPEYMTQYDNASNYYPPVIILGEKGSGRHQVATSMYMQGKYGNRPFIVVDFSLMNEKSWNYFIKNVSSPINSERITLLFDNIDSLPEQKFNRLLALITLTNLCKRNRVLFSSVAYTNKPLSEYAMTLINQLSCLPLNLPPLRKRVAEIPTIASLYIGTYNISLGKQVVGFTPEALSLLEQYSWPHNLTQFRRVLYQIMNITNTSYIQEASVEEVLSNEKKAYPGAVEDEPVIDLNKSLDEINADILRMVLIKHDNNHSKAAKQLGISRTTLWRMLNKK